jgi:hypothetical protein
MIVSAGKTRAFVAFCRGRRQPCPIEHHAVDRGCQQNGPSSAFASTTYQESVLGVETGPPQITTACGTLNSVSSFAGIARGMLNGVFQISVCHTPLDPSAKPSATILGGSFTLANRTTKVTGLLGSGGTVSLVGPPVIINSLCIETYAVIGGPEDFAGKLVHYGYWTGTSCNVFFATVSGSASLTA